MEPLSVDRLTSTRIPTVHGEFTLSLYENSQDDKDHLALIHGDVEGEEDVLVRVHSECFTGDVIGSLRCDCGEQLESSLRHIAEQGRGVLLYLRQEGRGIGLLNKLRAYDLQDEGYDTVEANLMLGHGADERDYSIAARMLDDLGVQSVRLLTNNPEKIESLEELGLPVSERVPLQPHLNRHNSEYLQTKADRMRHLLELGSLKNGSRANPHAGDVQALSDRAQAFAETAGRPFVTLTYAQSLDGSIAANPQEPLRISGPETLELTHALRAAHEGILVGINTVLSDDPQLTVRHADGAHPTPIVLDTTLRCPSTVRLLTEPGPTPIIATSEDADREKQSELEAAGAKVLRLNCDATGGICLEALLDALQDVGIRSLMVEGGGEVITSFIRKRLVDYLIITIAPMLVGGVHALRPFGTAGTDAPSGDGQPSQQIQGFPKIENIQYRWIGKDLVLEGRPVWPESQ
ncbi:GTP cyclohydrolase II [Longibacter salinarum]|uniref:GTP cyclohydrolase-2 n=1 Tax=Longibacter salinarum TaxID=1850348 RepID=A0A2A8D263_9BACT|nr:GTP cyclohydrolase II [Longibacter salinarum]PEN15062.1 GTP cyclohydrolase II [Longibacter salinarum]